MLRFRAPGLWKDWRLDALVGAERLVRYGYFGLGNATEDNDDLVTEETPFTYRVRRIRYEGRVEVTRRIRGPLHAAVRVAAVDMRYTTLPGPSLFINDFGEGLEEDEVSGRLALLYDTRNNEYNTTRGLFAEAGVQVGDAQESYSRVYGVVAGYYPVREGTVIAGRIGGSGTERHTHAVRSGQRPHLGREIPVLGGENSHRSFDTGRFLGDGTLFANLEVRHDVFPFGDLGGVTLVGVSRCGAGVRGGVVPAHDRGPARRRRRRRVGADPAHGDLRLQFRRRARRLQLLLRERLDVLAGSLRRRAAQARGGEHLAQGRLTAIPRVPPPDLGIELGLRYPRAVLQAPRPATRRAADPSGPARGSSRRGR